MLYYLSLPTTGLDYCGKEGDKLLGRGFCGLFYHEFNFIVELEWIYSAVL